MKMMMHDHLKLTTNEVVARLKQDWQVKQDWQAGIAAYDQVHTQILQMADGLSTGIVRQFPNKFRG